MRLCGFQPCKVPMLHDVCMGSKRLSAPNTGMRCAGLFVSAAPETAESAVAAVAAQQMLPALLLLPAFTRVEHVCAHIAHPVSAALAVDRAAVVVALQTLPPSWITSSLRLVQRTPLPFRVCSAGGGACGGGGGLAEDPARGARPVGPARHVRRVLHPHCLFRLFPCAGN